MAKVRGKFITLTGMLMSRYPQLVARADEYLITAFGGNHLELDPEAFYEAGVWNEYMQIYANAFPNPEEAIILLGKRVYPTIRRTVGLPHLPNALAYIKFEADGFLANHEGEDVIPRKFIKAEEGEVIVEAPAPDYDDTLYIGVFLGILEMCGVFTGKVERIEKNTFRITW